VSPQGADPRQPLREDGLEIGERIRAAWGHRPPDLLLRGARVLLPSGELAARDVAIVGRRIAAVGEDLVAPGELSVDLAGKTIVPGYVEPHTHGFGPLSIGSYCSQALVHGTTAVLTDDSFVYCFLEPEKYPAMLDVAARLPLLVRWSLRLDDPRTVPLSTVKELIERPDVVQVGEVIVRPELDDPNPELLEVMAAARSLGMRVEGHGPGASAPTLGVAAAAGITAEHEARSGEELLRRLRAGFWAPIRYTDLLPDAPAIVATALAEGISLERTSFTTDWSLPPWIDRRGIIDAVIATALEAGLPAAEAYATASRRPAVYLGLDAHFGTVAPGRLASVNVLSDLEQPTPERVFSLGREVAREGELLIEMPDIDWAGIEAPGWSSRRSGPVAATYVRQPGDPVLSLEKASLTRLGDAAGGAPLICFALDPYTETCTRAAIHGLPEGLEGIASTLTPQRLLIAAGSDAAALDACVDAVVAAGGGIAYRDRGKLELLPLPAGGAITSAPFAAVAAFWDAAYELFVRLGHQLPDPLSTLLYIGNPSLPGARFHASGLLDTRPGTLIAASQPAVWR
jgi:adenine deaminase